MSMGIFPSTYITVGFMPSKPFPFSHGCVSLPCVLNCIPKEMYSSIVSETCN